MSDLPFIAMPAHNYVAINDIQLAAHSNALFCKPVGHCQALTTSAAAALSYNTLPVFSASSDSEPHD